MTPAEPGARVALVREIAGWPAGTRGVVRGAPEGTSAAWDALVALRLPDEDPEWCDYCFMWNELEPAP